MKTQRFAFVLHGGSLYLDAGGHQIVSLIQWCYPVKYMIPCIMYIIRYLIFVGQHSFCIHIPGSCDQILCVGILAAEHISNQMAAIIQIFAIYKIVFYRMPAGGFYHTDGSSLLGGHDLLTYTGIRYTAAAQSIQRTVLLKSLRCIVRLGKSRHILVNFYGCLAAVCRYFVHRQRLNGRI